MQTIIKENFKKSAVMLPPQRTTDNTPRPAHLFMELTGTVNTVYPVFPPISFVLDQWEESSFSGVSLSLLLSATKHLHEPPRHSVLQGQTDRRTGTPGLPSCSQRGKGHRTTDGLTVVKGSVFICKDFLKDPSWAFGRINQTWLEGGTREYIPRRG